MVAARTARVGRLLVDPGHRTSPRDYIDAKAHLKIYLSRRQGALRADGAGDDDRRDADRCRTSSSRCSSRSIRSPGRSATSTTRSRSRRIKVDLHEPGRGGREEARRSRTRASGDAFSRAIQGFLNVLAVMLIGLGYLIPLLVIAALALRDRGGCVQRRRAPATPRRAARSRRGATRARATARR